MTRTEFSRLCSILFVVLLPGTTTLFSQIKSDTIILADLEPVTIKIVNYRPDGKIKEIYRGECTESDVAKDELFMKGQTVDDLKMTFKLDRRQRFDEYGIFEREEILPTPIILVRAHESAADLEGTSRISFSGKPVLAPKIVLEGNIGSLAVHEFEVMSLYPHKIKFYLTSDGRNIIYPDNISLNYKMSQALNIKALLPTRVIKEKLYFENEFGDTEMILIELNGHDLTSGDFATRQERARTIVLQDRNNLILKSDGQEKLIRLVKNNEVVAYFPFARKRTEINLKGFGRGTYLLEAVDLSTNQIKYAFVSLE